MSTTIRPEISSGNKYWISRHRYYELKHFCLQYPEWVKLKTYILESGSSGTIMVRKDRRVVDNTATKAMLISKLNMKMGLIRKAAYEADPDLAEYIFTAVTEGKSFAYLKTYSEMPCERDMYYDRYRKFFYILSNLRS